MTDQAPDGTPRPRPGPDTRPGHGDAEAEPSRDAAAGTDRRAGGPAAARPGRRGQRAQAVRPGHRARPFGGAGPGGGDWLPVLDNLDLALAHAGADPGAIIDGVRAVRDQARAVLQRLGFPRRDDLGAVFDPARHEAVGSGPGPTLRPARWSRSCGRATATATISCGRRWSWWRRTADGIGPRLLRDPGRARNASQEEIQRAYRKLARTYHPDVNKDPGAEDRFKEVSEAYDVCPIRRHAAATTRSGRTSAGFLTTSTPRPGAVPPRAAARGPAARAPAGGPGAGRPQTRASLPGSARTSTSTTCSAGCSAAEPDAAGGRSPARTRRPSST